MYSVVLDRHNAAATAADAGVFFFQNDCFNGRFRDLPQLKRLVVHSGVFNRPLDDLIESKPKLQKLNMNSLVFDQSLPDPLACMEFSIDSEAFNQSIPEMPCLRRFHLFSLQFNRPIRLFEGLLRLTLDACLFDAPLEFPDSVEYLELLTKYEQYSGSLRLMRCRGL